MYHSIFIYFLFLEGEDASKCVMTDHTRQSQGTQRLPLKQVTSKCIAASKRKDLVQLEKDRTVKRERRTLQLYAYTHTKNNCYIKHNVTGM